MRTSRNCRQNRAAQTGIQAVGRIGLLPVSTAQILENPEEFRAGVAAARVRGSTVRRPSPRCRDDLPPWLPPGFLMAAALERRAGNPTWNPEGGVAGRIGNMERRDVRKAQRPGEVPRRRRGGKDRHGSRPPRHDPAGAHPRGRPPREGVRRPPVRTHPDRRPPDQARRRGRRARPAHPARDRGRRGDRGRGARRAYRQLPHHRGSGVDAGRPRPRRRRLPCRVFPRSS